MTQSGDPDASELGPALRRLLRPLVKALIAKGVTAPSLYRVLKELYVEVAREDFRLDGEPPTDSRVSVITGVHRKDVRTLREHEGAEDKALGQRVSVLATVIGRWLADPRTTTPEGAPLPLPRQARDGVSFETLVESVSTDVRPRTILDELLRRGLVVLDGESDSVTLRGDALLSREGEGERFHFFSRNIGDHVSAAVENILTEEGPAPFLERAVFYNNLSAASVDAVEARARLLAGEVLAELNRLGFERQDADKESAEAGEANERFRFGVYFYREDEAAEDER
ncbi:DUF6502 family protein [Pelagibius sp.]|uniref:DUF6502 family protein n=1 Tax=Pelagibius sp. TaxID=1931238 RepID=UPI003B501DF7